MIRLDRRSTSPKAKGREEYFYDEETGMEYWYWPKTGRMESCHDGVGLITTWKITPEEWDAILDGNE